MSKIQVMGHKSPDTDTICSALVYADLKQQLGMEAEAVRLGEVNKETAYALEYAGVDAPKFISYVDSDVEEVILVDHNEFQQTVDNIKEVTIREVIDHHRVANFETANPLYFRAEPVGCTATIIRKIFREKAVDISKTNAKLLLSAIISDTLLFKSPTCTEEDREAAKALAKIGEVDIDTYGLDMLKAGADLDDKTIEELIEMDAKEFTMGNSKVEIAQINAIDVEKVYERQAEFETAIQEVVQQKGLDLFLLMVTDILNSNSEVLAIGEAENKVENAFQVKLDEHRALLEGVVSRKKQIVTPLDAAFN